jgi:outer membrane protein
MHPLRHPLPHLAATVVLIAFSGVAARAAHAETLMDAYQAARGFDTAFESAQANYDASVSRGEQLRAGFLPSASLTAGATTTSTDFSPGSVRTLPNQNIGINAAQPLYRPINRINFDEGQRQIDVYRAMLDTAAQDLMIRTSQAYFDVLAAKETLGFLGAQKAAVAEQLASAKRAFDVGTATITDTREAQARYDLVVAQEVAADNDLRVKQLALDQVTGQTDVKPAPLALPVTLPDLPPRSYPQWVDMARESQPAVRQAQLALELARLEVKKAKDGNLPTVDLVAGYNLQRNPNGTAIAQNGVQTRSASIGVQFNMPIFAGFAIQNRVRETLSLEEKAAADLETIRRNVAQTTRTIFFGAVSAAGQVKALEAAEASSQSALDANRLGYQVGVRINIDVLNAQSQLFQTKRDLAQARYNVLLGNLRLRQAAGTLNPQDLQNISALLVR